MDRLSSCYFCGVALDEPLQDYPLVATADEDPSAVVTLCPGCHRKLETVLGVVVTGDDPEESAPALEDTADRAALTGEDADDPVALAGTDPEPLAEPDETLVALDDGEARADEDEPGERDRADGEAGAEEADAETAPVDAADVTAAAREEHADAGTVAPDEGADQADDPADDVTDAAEADDGPSMSALEYNKVMRLLQNREFPVDRAEIVDVATNAYDLSEAECTAVLDLAVERGLVVEEDGRLAKPE